MDIKIILKVIGAYLVFVIFDIYIYHIVRENLIRFVIYFLSSFFLILVLNLIFEKDRK